MLFIVVAPVTGGVPPPHRQPAHNPSPPPVRRHPWALPLQPGNITSDDPDPDPEPTNPNSSTVASRGTWTEEEEGTVREEEEGRSRLRKLKWAEYDVELRKSTSGEPSGDGITWVTYSSTATWAQLTNWSLTRSCWRVIVGAAAWCAYLLRGVIALHDAEVLRRLIMYFLAHHPYTEIIVGRSTLITRPK